MRYIITPSQFHTLVYLYLDKKFSNKDFRKQINPYNEMTDNDWRIDMYDKEGRNQISYFWFGPGEYDDGSRHNGVGSIHVHPDIADFIRNTFSVRESKAVDIVADWVSEKLGVDIDEISVYPNRKNPPSY
jgi:hypothetical protein